ncbi:MAG: hypothetical protein ABL931_09135 [Usitatibacteraceae bacterium]
MFLNHNLEPRTRWTLRVIGWSVSVLIIFGLIYRATFNKRVEQTGDCLERTSSEERASTPLASVDKYARCIAGKAAVVKGALPERCRYAGTWTSARGTTAYKMTLDVDGKFIAEPAQNAPANATEITGAWAVAGRSLVWVYDSGAVWPPDLNPITAQTDDAFTLRETSGESTRFTLIKRQITTACLK